VTAGTEVSAVTIHTAPFCSPPDPLITCASHTYVEFDVSQRVVAGFGSLLIILKWENERKGVGLGLGLTP